MLKLKQHTVFGKHCEHLKIIRMQNLKQQLLETCFIIKVTMAQARTFIHFCAVVLLFFVRTVMHALDYKEGCCDSQKHQNFTSFVLVLPIFFLMCGWGLALAMHPCNFELWNSYVHPHYFTEIKWHERLQNSI